jgi:hypothetical protein
MNKKKREGLKNLLVKCDEKDLLQSAEWQAIRDLIKDLEELEEEYEELKFRLESFEMGTGR